MKKLFTVIRQRNFDEVKKIIEKKPELVNCIAGPTPKKDHGQSPLQVAFKTGNYEIAGYLIEHGADINFMEAEDDDPGLRAPVLFDAINAAIISLCYNSFIETEIDFKRNMEESKTAFSYVRLLIEMGADVNKKASNGYCAIDWTVTTAENILNREKLYPLSQEPAKKLLMNILDLLIEAGTDFAAWAKRGHYPEPCPGPSNKSMFIDEFVPTEDGTVDKTKNLRAVIQEYIQSRNLVI